jgi:hypothetical protein
MKSKPPGSGIGERFSSRSTLRDSDLASSYLLRAAETCFQKKSSIFLSAAGLIGLAYYAVNIRRNYTLVTLRLLPPSSKGSPAFSSGCRFVCRWRRAVGPLFCPHCSPIFRPAFLCFLHVPRTVLAVKGPLSPRLTTARP